jgi:catalase
MTNKKCLLTTTNGAPVADDDTSISAGERGSLTFDNFRMFEKLTHFNRERIPERIVHARGSAAYGAFTLTRDMADYSIADFLHSAGKETEVFVRFSTVGGGQDSSDYARDPRGFAVKFYTDQGNWDMVGNNTPVFFLRDPIKFPDFVHSQKKNPQTNLPDAAAVYEFWANSPQSLHQMTILMSDRGIPQSYRHIDGFSSHTLSLWNDKGERVWVKFHFKTNQGIETLTQEETAGLPAHGAQQDLVESINKGDYPSWRVCVQIMSEDEAKTYRFNPFDVTKVWPYGDYPLIEIGTMELNRNVENYFAETEQVTFSPGNLVPGVGASPDKMLQARMMAYPDAHRYRVGVNSAQLPVNSPRCPVNHYQRDGAMAGMRPTFVGSNNQGAGVNFYPNDRTTDGVPAPQSQFSEPPIPLESDAWIKPHATVDDDNFTQAGDLFRIMDAEQRQRLATTIAGGLCQATPAVQQRMLEQFAAADPQYRALVEEALSQS